MKKVISHFLIALSLLLGSGCSTSRSERNLSVYIKTIPPGAICEIRRDGRFVESVNPTPNSINLNKSNKSIDITCALPNSTNSEITSKSGDVDSVFTTISATSDISMALAATKDTGKFYSNGEPEMDVISLDHRKNIPICCKGPYRGWTRQEQERIERELNK